MSSVMTYASLLTTAKSYLERYTDTRLDGQLPVFVGLAENRIAADLKLLGTQQVVVGAFSLHDPVVEKPAYWRDNVSINYTDSANRRVPLYLRTYEFCRVYSPVETTYGPPRYYADYDAGHLFVSPTPDVAYVIELVYHARLDPLDDINQENWLTFHAPQLMLAATILEAQLWLRNVAETASWQAQYDAARSSLGGENAQRKTDRTTVVTS